MTAQTIAFFKNGLMEMDYSFATDRDGRQNVMALIAESQRNGFIREDMGKKIRLTHTMRGMLVSREIRITIGQNRNRIYARQVIAYRNIYELEEFMEGGENLNRKFQLLCSAMAEMKINAVDLHIGKEYFIDGKGV